MELELGLDYECETRDRSNCVVLGKKIESFFKEVVTRNREFFEGEGGFQYNVKKIVQKREDQLRRSHERRLRWVLEVINTLIVGIPTTEELAHIQRLSKTAKHQADKALKTALKRARGTRQFDKLYAQSYLHWKKHYDRNLRADLYGCIHGNRSIRDIHSEFIFQRRSSDLDNELSHVNFNLKRDHSRWESVDWMWTEPETINSRILDERTLEDYCYGEKLVVRPA